MTKRQIIIIILSSLIVLTVGITLSVRRYHETPVVHTETTTVPHVATSKTTLEVTSKETKSDPNLIVETKYVAQVNGQIVAAPLTTRIDESTAKVTTEIDVTPLIKQMTPKWEIGVGLGYHKDDLYVPVSIQRNYKMGKAVVFELHLDPSDNMRPNGVEFQHKWYW